MFFVQFRLPTNASNQISCSVSRKGPRRQRHAAGVRETIRMTSHQVSNSFHPRFCAMPPLFHSSLGWLYSQVATRTMNDPRRKVNVMEKLNRATDARKEKTMLRLVAKPFRMFPEYLMTIAVTSPPTTCVTTVAHAHRPKLSKRHTKFLLVQVMSFDSAYVNMMGESAGRRENIDNWTLRIQMSPGVFLRTIS